MEPSNHHNATTSPTSSSGSRQPHLDNSSLASQPSVPGEAGCPIIIDDDGADGDSSEERNSEGAQGDSSEERNSEGADGDSSDERNSQGADGESSDERNSGDDDVASDGDTADLYLADVSQWHVAVFSIPGTENDLPAFAQYLVGDVASHVQATQEGRSLRHLQAVVNTTASVVIARIGEDLGDRAAYDLADELSQWLREMSAGSIRGRLESLSVLNDLIPTERIRRLVLAWKSLFTAALELKISLESEN